MKRSIFLLVIIYFVSILCGNCQSTTLKNCTVVVNYKGTLNREILTIFENDPYQLYDGTINQIFYSVDSSKSNKIIFNFGISKPSFVFIGFNELYLEPGDRIELNLLPPRKATGTFPVLELVSGKTFFSQKLNTNPIISSTADSLLYIYNKVHKDVSKPASADSEANQMFDDLIKKIPLINTDTVCAHDVHDLCKEYFYRLMVAQSLKSKGKLSDSMRLFFISYSNKVESFSHAPFWTAFRYISFAYAEQFKQDGFNYEKILQTIKPYNDTVQQFFLLQFLKNYDRIIKKDTINFKKIIGKITYSPFLPYVNQIRESMLPIQDGGMPSTLQNITVYNFDYVKLKFSQLFLQTKQRLVIFDFCGSWCTPCLKEIEEYSKLKTLDTSKTIRPIWLFFENDSLKWKNVVLKYGLKKEDCFLVLDRSAFVSEFGRHYDWRREFPHHVIFRKDGRLFKNNAKSLSFYNQNEVDKLY